MTSDTGMGGERPLPLEGVRVLDFTQVMMGPCCTQMLGDYGADVIKIERVGAGDLSRWSVGEDPDGGNNPVFASLNRNKRSVALDLKSEADRQAALSLVETADVVVSNFRPGVMERMGFGYDDLRRLNRRIIYAVGTGFGLEGPYVHKGGQDVLAQAMSGAMHRRADPALPLSIYPTALADYSAGMHLVQGILLALLQREKTGEGQQDRGLALQLHAGDADAGSSDVDDAGPRTELGRHAALRRVRDRRTAPSSWWARSRRTRCATSAMRSGSTIFPPIPDTPPWSNRSLTGRNCRRFSGTASPATPPHTGWRGSTRSTSSAPRW